MNNLFSIFDPSSLMGLNLNWASSGLGGLIFIPSLFWVSKGQITFIMASVLNHLNLEMKLTLGEVKSPGVTHMLISLFIFIVLNNTLGLLPYVFTSSSHLSFSLTLSLMIWCAVMAGSLLKDLNAVLAHLVPVGTPYFLMPLMVLIEIVSNIIRPITLSVRLAANMVAGHLLLTLLGNSSSELVLGVIIALILMMMLEVAVAVIQAYVFSTLSSLYVSDVNSKNIWKVKSG